MRTIALLLMALAVLFALGVPFLFASRVRAESSNEGFDRVRAALEASGIDPDAALIPPKKKVAKAPINDPEFQAKVAIESLKGEASVEKLSRDFLVETGQIKEWRSQLIEGAPSLFREG